MTTPSYPTILVVDEDRDCRNVYGALFRRAGFGVQEATTGDEALSLAAANPDVVVMELLLSDIDGSEV